MIAVNVALTRFRNNIGIIEKIKEPLTFYSQGLFILKVCFTKLWDNH
jgi:hypothetical protein